MIRYLKAIRSLFSRKKPENDEIDIQSEEFISDDDCSASIEIRLNRVSLGLLLFLNNSGNLKEYFTEAYGNWAQTDSKRISFLHNMYVKWLDSEDSFTDEYDKLAVKPSSVFGLNPQVD
jgi:hypothetical protein